MGSDAYRLRHASALGTRRAATVRQTPEVTAVRIVRAIRAREAEGEQ